MTSVFRSVRGMTLTEVLIALALTASITAALATSWGLIVKFQERADTFHHTWLHPGDVMRLHRYLGAVVEGDPLDAGGLRQSGNETGSELLLTTFAGPFNRPDLIMNPCHLRIRCGDFNGIKVELQGTPLERLVPGSTAEAPGAVPVLSTAFQHAREGTVRARLLETLGPMSMEALGPDDRWYRQWPAAGHRGAPRAIRFQSIGPTSADIVISLSRKAFRMEHPA